jgi:competence protein ComGC
MRCRLLVILHLLIIVGLLLVVIIGNMSRANAEVSQLDRSQ